METGDRVTIRAAAKRRCSRARLMLLVAAVALACTPKKPVAAARSGTARMRDTLAALYAKAVADPTTDAFLNRERVAYLKAELAKTSGAEAYNLRHMLAEEQLRAGDARDAIAGLEGLLRDANLSWDQIEPRKKPVFDLLAVAWLRLGEQENCADNVSANVCILPLAGGARHTKQEGARHAIESYTKLLKQFPDDKGSQWLLNVAYLQVGGYPDSVPKAYLIPHLAPKPNDPFPLYQNIAANVGLAINGLAGGASIADFNGDGLLDVFTTGWGLNDPVRVKLADGRGGYADRTAEAGLYGIVSGLNNIHADYDNDGDEDIVVLRGAWLGENGNLPFSLLRNRGDGKFDDVTFEAGLFSLGPSNTASWVDFNQDGYLDLFVGYESRAKLGNAPSHPSKLFLNNRNGTFSEVAAKVGITLDEYVKGATWGDINNDGLPDLFVSVLYGKNKLYLNRGGTSIDTWHFEECAASAGVELPLASFPTWFWDFDNDGWDDLLVLSYDVNAPMADFVAREYLGMPYTVSSEGAQLGVESTHLFRNKHDGTFEDVTKKAGLADKVIFAMGSNFGDLDNDGWPDFYVGTGNPALQSVVPNRMFRNVQGKRFEEVTLPGGFGHIQKGHAVAFADLDRDGDEDVFEVIGGAYQGDTFTSVLFENPGWPANKWLTLDLQGRTANRSAIGARVTITITDAKGASRLVSRTVRTGGSFGAGPLELHVGLGPATRIDSVHIVWPDKAQSATSHRELALNSTYRIVQGDAPKLLERPVVPFRAAAPGTAPPMKMSH